MSQPADRQRSRVLVLIKGLGIGGAEKLISEGSKHWDRDAYEYQVAYVLPWKDQLVGELADNGIEVTCVGGDKGLDMRALSRLRALVRRFRPDLVHAHLPSAGILARMLSPPTIYTEHNIVDYYRRPTRALNRATYWRNAAVIAVSGAVAESIARYPGPEPVVVPNGVIAQVEPGAAHSVRTELDIAPNRPLVVHVGNMRPHKGHDNLVAATALLAETTPDVLVVSIGAEKFPGDHDRLRQTAAAAGVSEEIRFLGRRPDALDFLAAADVVVNPSDVEGLPVTLLEALSLSRPVVATSVGGVPSVVIHEKTGLLVAPGDPRALAESLQRALTASEATAWGRAGADLVATDHSADKMIGAYENLYRDVLDD